MDNEQDKKRPSLAPWFLATFAAGALVGISGSNAIKDYIQNHPRLTTMYEFYEYGDKAVEKFESEGIEVADRQEALDELGFRGLRNIRKKAENAPTPPPDYRWSVCENGNNASIDVTNKEGVISIKDSKNYDGWSGTNKYKYFTLHIGEDPLEWSSSAFVEEFDLQKRGGPSEQAYLPGFLWLCESSIVNTYRQELDKGYYSCREESYANLEKTITFLEELETFVCPEPKEDA